MAEGDFLPRMCLPNLGQTPQVIIMILCIRSTYSLFSCHSPFNTVHPDQATSLAPLKLSPLQHILPTKESLERILPSCSPPSFSVMLDFPLNICPWPGCTAHQLQVVKRHQHCKPTYFEVELATVSCVCSMKTSSTQNLYFRQPIASLLVIIVAYCISTIVIVVNTR